jgi:hypothetical protein
LVGVLAYRNSFGNWQKSGGSGGNRGFQNKIISKQNRFKIAKLFTVKNIN